MGKGPIEEALKTLDGYRKNNQGEYEKNSELRDYYQHKEDNSIEKAIRAYWALPSPVFDFSDSKNGKKGQ